MLSYEEFKKELIKQLFNYMPPEFAQGKIILSSKEKNGIQKEGFYIQGQDNKEDIFMLFEPIYTKLYMNTYDGDFEKTVQEVSLLYKEQSIQVAKEPFYLKIEDDKEGNFDILFDPDKVFFCVVNKKSNQEYMATIPHQDKGDMSMYLRLLLSNDGEYINSIIIDKNLLNQIERSGIDFNNLVSYAAKNTPQLFPAQINKIHDNIYYISNKSGLFGSSTLFYTDNPLQSVTNMNDMLINLIVLPCSNDFCMAFSTPEPTAITDEEMYKQYNVAIRAYVKEYGGSALAAYPFLYDGLQGKLITDKENILMSNMEYRKKERSL